MSQNNTFTIIKDTFGKKDSDETVDGLTVIVDGKLKDIFDTIIMKSNKYDNYTSILTDVILHGINKVIGELDK